MRHARALWVRSALASGALLAILSGPTPGAVGSCGGDDLSGPADVVSYCSKREQLICVRRGLRREITSQETDTCRRAAISQCENRSWLPQCQPSERQARACLNALESLDTVNTKESELHECTTAALCGASFIVPQAAGGQAGTGAQAGSGSRAASERDAGEEQEGP